MIRINTNRQSPIANRQYGFTLIEVLVAVSVFAVTVTSLVGAYLSVQRLNQQSRVLQVLLQNSRYILEDITKIIRNGQIDYASYGGSIPQPSTSDLFLVDQEGVKIWIYRQETDLVITKTGIGSSNLNGPEIKVLDFKVFISPSTNPFPKGPATPKEQPTATIFLDLESRISPRDVTRFPFQTTVATRQYPQ